jgi:hypothetical protein
VSGSSLFHEIDSTSARWYTELTVISGYILYVEENQLKFQGNSCGPSLSFNWLRPDRGI